MINQLQPIPEEVVLRLETWQPIWKMFLYLHYTLGVLGVLSSSLAAALPSDQSIMVTAFAVTSACCFAVIGFVSPERRYLGLMRAWRTLHVAASRYQRGLLTIEQLLLILEQTEAIATEPTKHDVAFEQLGISTRVEPTLPKPPLNTDTPPPVS